MTIKGDQTLNGRGPIASEDIAVAGPTTLTVGENGTVHTNKGATALTTLVLPAAVVGLWFDFFVLAAYELAIDPDGTEVIALPSTGAYGAAGKKLSADAVGEYVRLICLETGKWAVRGYAGTWTAES